MHTSSTAYLHFTRRIKAIFLLASAFSLLSCDKNLSEKEITPVAPVSISENGGSWKPMVLSSSSEVSVPDPSPVTSSDYQNELQTIKNLQANLTDAQKSKINYWAGNPVVRWNEITRELVAKYNLPPASNADGTYPAPDASNPTVYPLFPFSNPPYAARAYAMLAIAQYDALIATWQQKYQHKRPAPYTVDATIQALVPVSQLPAYPSEDAVIAAASVEMLKVLFPGEVAYLTDRAEEHKLSRLWAGANVPSDMDAGEQLGRAIAQKIIDYCKTDGMKNAAGNKDMWKAYEETAIANGQIPWKSLETPARPPMLMAFGKVRPWLLSNADVIALRPAAPPAIGSPAFQKDIQEVKHYSEKITREEWKIAAFWADGVNTYTPPGHWNAIASDLIVKNKMNPLQTARTMALMNAAVADAGICTWDVKFLYYLPRPSQIDPEIKTATGVPNFPSYTSGHATFSGAASTVLAYVFPEEKDKLEAMAQEAAMSRLYASIHYRFDCEVGLQCGKNIAQFAVQKGKSDGSPQ